MKMLPASKNRGGIIMFIFILIFLVLCAAAAVLGAFYFRNSLAADNQCALLHTTYLIPPFTPKTAKDFFDLGNYDYESGNCKKAVADYSKAIALNPSYAEAYNNRAYTNMRMQNYKDALPDLDQAIRFRPNYAHALMNRGDIYNFYYNVDHAKAIADYDRVIATGKISDTSVCAHLILAENNGWSPLTIFKLIRAQILHDRPGC